MMDLIKSVKGMKIWRIRHPSCRIRIDLNDAGYIFCPGLSDRLQEDIVADILDQQIRDQELSLRQLTCISVQIQTGCAALRYPSLISTP